MNEPHDAPLPRTILPVAAPERRGPHALTPVVLALRESVRRFVARRAHPDHVDDLVQDIFLRMHERAGDLRDEARLAGWAFQIARSVVADHHRAKRAALPLSGSDDPADAPLEEGNVNEIVAGWLQPMLALLPDEYGEALELVDIQGMSQRDYAARAGLSLSGAKSRVQRGRKMLEEIVHACCELERDTRGNIIAYRRRCGCD